MTQLHIDLPDEINDLMKARARAAGCASAEEYVRVLILADASDPGGPQWLSFESDDRLEEFLEKRLDQPVQEMTDRDFDVARERLRQLAIKKRGS